ncbi:MAG: tobH protein [Rhodococcus sp.]|nr:tobH protein [Rhodococcus sp. (in: high G+C Gram-positive bacteria)]
MTAPMPLLDLDDGDALVGADVDGMLRSAATGGAQIRATHSAVQEGALDRLQGLRPRSVVLVTGSGRAGRAASLVTALLAPHLGFPVVHVSHTPRWVGSLDVVVVAGDDAGDPRLADAVDGAVRRGAEVVVAAPDEGPLRGASAGRAMVLAPRIPAAPQHGLLRFCAVYLAVVATLEAKPNTAMPNLSDLADAVDAEALRDSPVNEVFHNPAKSLAAQMHGRRIVLVGDTESAVELACAGAEALLYSGRVAAAAELADALRAGAALASTVVESPHADPIFHDPDLDGPVADEPVRFFALAPQESRHVTERRLVGLSDGVLVVADPDEVDGAASSRFEEAAVLATRLDMAAAYLRLTGGR